MKILNIYGGVGGNRKLWGDDHDITMVELHPGIASVYQKLYQDDTVVVGDAHQYLLDHILDGWDFIWSSPPCPSHSVINRSTPTRPRYPEMGLYQEIILLGAGGYKGKWCVENVIPYYDPLIEPTICIDRHLFWSNFNIYSKHFEKEKTIKYQLGSGERYGISLDGFNVGHDKRQVLRNLVNPEIGKHILNAAENIYAIDNRKQINLF